MERICDVCGKKTDNYVITGDGDVVCENCRPTNLHQCHCGAWILISKPRCNCCEEKLYKMAMNPYSTKPVPMFKNHYTDKRSSLFKQRYYGFEMEFNDSDPLKVYSLGYELYQEKLIYNKSDSSIYSGVEVVTSPLDRESVQSLFNRLEPVFNYVKTRNYTNGAGLHIHVSKDSISVQDRYKLCLLLNNSEVSPMEKSMMYYLSGRIDTPGYSVNDNYYAIGTMDGWRCTATGHSKALNTANSSTYEFRIFKSSADKDVLMSYVELTDKMIEFCNINGIKDITIGKFINWLKVNTRNDIIKTKIKEFESRQGELPTISRIITPDKIMEYFKGIKWSDYGRLASALQYYRNVPKAIRNFSTMNEASNPYGFNSNTQERLLRTYRLTAINYILKNQKSMEELECA